jgi:predicted ArsR family transcriptional regulator
MQRTRTVKTLDSVRALTHPLRQKILGLLIDEPLTIRELAAKLGMKVHPLYHHVDVLHDSGMIRVVSRRQTRGAVERKYRATASCFSVSPAAVLSSPDRRRTGARLAGIAGEMAAGAVSEIRRQGDLIQADAREGKTPLISQVRVRGSKSEVDALRDQIHQLLEAFQRQGCNDGCDEYELTLFFYPRRES